MKLHLNTKTMKKKMMRNLEIGREKYRRTIINDFNDKGRSLLYLASRNGHLRVVLWLVCNGANTNLKIKDSLSTPLHAAAFYGHPLVVRFLVTAEWQKDILNKYRLTTALRESKTDDIRRFIKEPTRGDAGRFTVPKQVVYSFDDNVKKAWDHGEMKFHNKDRICFFFEKKEWN